MDDNPGPASSGSIEKEALIVDDGRAYCELLTHQLQEIGLRVSSVYSADDALHILQRTRFAVILLDIIMPGTDGVDLLRQIKADPGLADIPVIMLTGLDDDEKVVECLAAGAHDYLVKTVDVLLISTRIARCIRVQQSSGAASSMIVRGEHARILIADDNGFSRDVLERFLEKDRYTTFAATNGQEAIEMLGREEIDLLLLDINMPVMDGLETLKLLWQDSRFTSLPVVMLSGNTENEMIHKCLTHGADDYLIKTFNPIMLRSRIKSFITS